MKKDYDTGYMNVFEEYKLFTLTSITLVEATYTSRAYIKMVLEYVGGMVTTSVELSYREFVASFKNATPEERMKFIATFPSICNDLGLSMTEDEQLFVALEML